MPAVRRVDLLVGYFGSARAADTSGREILGCFAVLHYT
jgi:hypothetical protein